MAMEVDEDTSPMLDLSTFDMSMVDQDFQDLMEAGESNSEFNFDANDSEDIQEPSLDVIKKDLEGNNVPVEEDWENCKREVKAKSQRLYTNEKQDKNNIPAEYSKLVSPSIPFTDKNFLDINWNTIKDGVVSVFMHGHIPDDPDYYLITRTITKVARDNRSEELMKRIRSIMNEYIPKIFEEVISCEKTEEISDIAYKNWTDYKLKMSILDRIFYPVNGRCGLRVMFPLRPISTLIVLHLFTDKIELMRKVASGLLHLLNKHRLTGEIDAEKLKFLVGMFNELRCYESVFEPILERETEKFYQIEAEKQYNKLDLAGYVDYCNQRIDEEGARADNLLSPSSKGKLFRVLRKSMVEDYATSIVNKGADVLFEAGKTSDVKKLYQLLDNSKEGHNSLKTCFANYVKKVGKIMISDDSKDKTMVDDLLKFKADLDVLIKDCFNSNDKFIQAEKDAFSYFINTRPNKPAELIAKYMDAKMKSAINKNVSEKEFDDLMDRVIVLFRFIQGKDVFEAFYKRDLAKRLLLGKSASVDAEKAMLLKLRCECGAQFTSKLEGMFRDIEVSRDINYSFKSHIEKSDLGKSPVEFSVHVLTLSFWPNYTPMEVHIPGQLCEFQQAFNNYYVDRNKGRKLTWQYSLANAIIIAHFKNGKKELDVSLFQSLGRKLTWQYSLANAIIIAHFKNGKKELDVSLFQSLVLLMFNDKDSFTFAEIHDFTKIEEKELIRTMLSLVGKTPILKREKSEKQKITPDERFEFNNDFTEKGYKIKISQVQMKESEKEKQQTEDEIQQDRIYVIDANIVRLMKQNQTMNHNNLITELISQLRFKAKPQDFKKRIESLIEREYMARDESNPQVYKYVA
uniref:Cullin family profile domain-containing protein n=1 Tax=Panagrolaimus sp. JU765 TaxID=591449 RepID=A0AC34QXM2_9BILA